MKFTDEDLMKAMGIQVGDVIRFNDSPNKWTVINEKYIALDPEVDRYIDGGFKIVDEIPIIGLIGVDFNILPKPKRVGNLKCGECSCTNCQLRGIGCRNVSTNTKNTLYEILDKYFEEYPDQEIYDLLKARLDKEVLEDEKH